MITHKIFEKHNPVPALAFYNNKKDGYFWFDQPTVNHPFNEAYRLFKNGWDEAMVYAGDSENNAR